MSLPTYDNSDRVFYVCGLYSCYTPSEFPCPSEALNTDLLSPSPTLYPLGMADLVGSGGLDVPGRAAPPDYNYSVPEL